MFFFIVLLLILSGVFIMGVANIGYLHLIAICAISGVMIGGLVMGQVDITKDALLILGGFISGEAIGGRVESVKEV